MADERGNFIYNNARLALQKSHRQEHRLLHEKVRPYFTGKWAYEYSYSYAITILTERHRGEYRRLVQKFREEYAKRTIFSTSGSSTSASRRVSNDLSRRKGKSRKK